MEKEPKGVEKEPTPKSVLLKSDWFDQWGVNPDTVYTVEVLNKNADLPVPRPDFGVVITKPDGTQVAHIIGADRASVKSGDKVKFFREERRY